MKAGYKKYNTQPQFMVKKEDHFWWSCFTKFKKMAAGILKKRGRNASVAFRTSSGREEVNA
jgi:hypothetical protein